MPPQPDESGMDVLGFIKLLLRHWFIVSLAILCTGFGAFTLAQKVAPEYQASGSLLLLSPSSTEGPGGERVAVNPYTRFGSSEGIAAQTLVNVSLSQAFDKRAKRLGIEEYAVTIDPSGGGAIINIRVVDETSRRAVDGLSRLRDLIEQELTTRQQEAGAPRPTWITLEDLAIPDTADKLTGSKVRAVAAVCVLGVLVAATLAVLAESVRTHRKKARRERRRKQRRVEAAAQPGDDGQDSEVHGVVPQPESDGHGRGPREAAAQPAGEVPDSGEREAAPAAANDDQDGEQRQSAAQPAGEAQEAHGSEQRETGTPPPAEAHDLDEAPRVSRRQRRRAARAAAKRMKTGKRSVDAESEVVEPRQGRRQRRRAARASAKRMKTGKRSVDSKSEVVEQGGDVVDVEHGIDRDDSSPKAPEHDASMVPAQRGSAVQD